MKKYVVYLVCLFASLGFVACDSEGDSLTEVNGYIELTEAGASTAVLKGYISASEEFSVLTPSGFTTPIYIKDQSFCGTGYDFLSTSAKRLDGMTSMPADGWASTAKIEDKATYWVRHTTLSTYRYLKIRVAYILGNQVGVEYVIDKTEERPNTNANSSVTAYATNWEMPAINAANTFVAHTVSADGSDVLNYSYEWNATMKHAEWVAFSFDEQTCKDVTGRTDAWDVDPLLPAELQTSNANHTNDGFDRGHICASEDRVWSVDANKQTFYFSNMSPQLASFNQKFWVSVENQIRKWGRAIPTTYDKVYVVKGGTLNHLLKGFTGAVKGADGKIPTTDADGFTMKGLACPQYYFAAVLSEKDGAYKAIAFLVEHKEGLPEEPTTAELQQYVVSIDSLETFSGIDFFCNLPDDLEDEVESAYNTSDWAW